MSDEKKPEPKKLFDCKIPKHPLTVDIRGRGVGDTPYTERDNGKPFGGPVK
jgi:hypothetical protein